MYRRFQPIALALLALACLVTATNASAMLNPRLGQFMQRDPSGMPGFVAPRSTAGSFVQRDRFPGQPKVFGDSSSRQHLIANDSYDPPQSSNITDDTNKMYPDGMNLYAAYHVMRGGLDPDGLKTITVVIIIDGTNTASTFTRHGWQIEANLQQMFTANNLGLTRDKVSIGLTSAPNFSGQLGWQTDNKCLYYGKVEWLNRQLITAKSEFGASTPNQYGATEIFVKSFEGGLQSPSIKPKHYPTLWANVIAHEQLFHGMTGGTDNNKAYKAGDFRNNLLGNALNQLNDLSGWAKDFRKEADAK